MARRDVDLVIKARDEAASVVDSITKALNEFIDAQRNLDTRADKTEGSLASLGAAIGQLDKQLRGLSAGDKLAQELTRAETALARLEGQFDGTQQEAAQLERQLARTSAQTERYAQKIAGAAAAQERQRAALTQAKQDQRELTAAYEQAVAAQDKLARRQSQLPQLIERASIATDKAARRFDELSAQIAGTEKPSATLIGQLAASQRAVESSTQKLRGLQNEYTQITGQLRAAGSAITLFGAQAEKATANVSQQERVIDKIGVNLAELKVQGNAAAQEQSRLSSEFDKASASLRRQGTEIERARDNYVQLAASAGQARDALARLAQGGLEVLEQQFRNQRRVVLETKREYLQARDAATQLGAQIAKTAAPSAELVAAFQRAKIASSSLKQDLLDQRVAYEQLSRALRETTGDYESVRGAQERFGQVQTELAQRLNQTAQAADRQERELNQLSGATSRSTGTARQLASEQARLARVNDQAAGSTGRLAAAYRQFYGDTRRSLSFLQRVRGEILSLVAAYGGLFAAIEVLRGTVDATQQLEAAQARLGVAFNGDQERVAQELDFLRRTANRLGVDLGTLATEYSKFNIAAKDTSLEGEAARKIFVQVAEAARVNRSSTAELSGVFVALTQIISKGAVQMEELRQQLGDRLPGALQIMAAGLGVTTAELIKMLEQGQVTEAALIPFAEELSRRFGPGLGEALASTNVAIGRLGNAAFQALVRFGEAGFIESFQDFVNTLTDTLNSADFEAFANRASAALGQVVDFLGFLAQNFQLVVAAATGFIGLRLTPIVLALAANFRDAAAAGLLAARGITTAGAAATGATGGFIRAAAAARGLTTAFRVLLSSTGIGLAITAISIGIGLWATEADTATEAMTQHRDILDKVKDAYDAVGGAVDEWREKLNELTVSELQGNLRRVQEALESTRAQLDAAASQDGTFLTNFFGLNLAEPFNVSRQYRDAIAQVVAAFRSGEVPAEQLLSRLEEVNREYDDGTDDVGEYAESVIKAARAELEGVKAAREAELAIQARTGTTEDAAEAARELGLANEQAAEALDPERAANFNAAMETLKKTIEETSKSTEYLAQVMKIEGAFEQAIANASTLEERVLAAISASEALQGAAQRFVDTNFGSFTSGIEASAALLREFEGFRATPYFDVNALRAGFGSDTITLADGTIQRVVEGTRVSVEDANRDLIRRITTEFAPRAEAAAGSARFASFTPQQQAALISIAYNYGDIPDRIVDAIRTGSDEQIAEAIRSLAGDNDGVNRNRRFQEAALFTSGAAIDTQVREAERRAEEEERAREATAERLQQNEFEIGQQELINAGKERQAAIEAAIQEAKRENPAITAAEIAAIEEQTGKLFDLEQAQKNIRTEKEKAQDAEEEVNRLLTIRQQLQEQLELANQQGDVTQAGALRQEINAVNAEMTKAIDNAIAMWEAVGGSEAEAAIAKLTTAKLQAEQFGFQAENTYLQWNRVADLFVQGLASAFDTFAQKVAEGVPVAQAARDAFLQFASDFLRQIAQMIIQQAIFNALQAALGGTSVGGLIGLPVGTGHTGGMVGSKRVGSGNSTRRVNPALFAGALRYHTGGFPGLRPGEVPIIAKTGEEILTEDDPRNMMNLAGAGGGTSRNPITLINAVDGSEALQQALSQSAGQEVFLNFVRTKKSEIKQLLG